MSDKLLISAKPPKGEYEYKIFSVRVKSEIVDKLEEISFDTGRSRNEIVGMMLEFALENYGIIEGRSSELTIDL